MIKSKLKERSNRYNFVLFISILVVSLGIVLAETGFIGIFINLGYVDVNIVSPENTTYSFPAGVNYTIELNVTSLNDIASWSYTLVDLKHNYNKYENEIFTPNSSFNAARWGNKLVVRATAITGEIGSDEVYFYVDVPDTAPLIGNIPNQSYACEGSSYFFDFNVTNLDEDYLFYQLTPSNPFYSWDYGNFLVYDFVNYAAAILSDTYIEKDYVGDYSLNLSVFDGVYTDSRNFNITVIEINNLPIINNIGVITLYTFGENSTFYRQIYASDFENGNSSSGNLSFNISFSGDELFEIDDYGYINFSANITYLGVHNFSVCVNDSDLSYIHPNISLCGSDGLQNVVCSNFSITVTDENRAPRITDYYPNITSFNISGDQEIYFNVSVYDPDYTLPDAYWYIDDLLMEYDFGSNSYDYYWDIPCGISGNHNLSVLITDGLENVTLTWNITVYMAACISTSGGSGGGGGGGSSCERAIVCDLWSSCFNLERSKLESAVSIENYFDIKKNCSFIGLFESDCGYQMRGCFDANNCNKKEEVIPQTAICQYTEAPTCEDGIKNCHSGSCEDLIDCGGPCDACYTCSDGINNQGELGIDCGGPCPITCKREQPLLKKEELKYAFYIIFLILLILMIILLIINILRIIRIKKEVGELKWYELVRARRRR